MLSVRLILHDPLQPLAQQLEHRLGQDHILLLPARQHLRALSGENAQASGWGHFPLQRHPFPPYGVPGAAVHHTGHRRGQLPLKEHHRLQRLLSKQPVCRQLGQKAVPRPQAAEHILKILHRIGQHFLLQFLWRHTISTPL